MFRFQPRPLAALAAALLLSACYRVTVVSAPVPLAANTVVDRPWNHSFVIGLVPPPPVDVARPCGGAVSQVVTQRSFLNGLVGALTFSVYTPLQVTVTCAGPRVAAAAAGTPGPDPLATALAAPAAARTSPAPAGPNAERP